MQINTTGTPGGMRERCVAAIVAKLDTDPALTVEAAGRLVAVDTANEAAAKGWAPVTCEYLVRFVATVAAELVADGVRELATAGAQ